MDRTIKADNLHILPSCHDCIACQAHDVEHCRYLIKTRLCRVLVWLRKWGLEK